MTNRTAWDDASEAEVTATWELNKRAEQAWSDAWDRARDLDEKKGRPYDRHRYSRLAHMARVDVLGVCESPSCKEHKKAVRS